MNSRPNAPIDNIRHVRCVDVIYHPKKGIYCESYCEVESSANMDYF